VLDESIQHPDFAFKLKLSLSPLKLTLKSSQKSLAIKESFAMADPQNAQASFDLASGPQTAVLVSGGLGVAPMPLAARDARAAGMQVTWVHGARTADELCTEADGDEVIWATDDGSHGFAGTAVAAVPDADLVLACGPNRMLAAVALRWPEAQVAVETYMGCGTGVCLGCAVPLERGGYDRACKEGPVYRAADIEWSMLPVHLPYAITA